MRLEKGKLGDHNGNELVGQIQLGRRWYPWIRVNGVDAVIDDGVVKYLNQADVREALKRAEK
jgi:hypothetical protein